MHLKPLHTPQNAVTFFTLRARYKMHGGELATEEITEEITMA